MKDKIESSWRWENGVYECLPVCVSVQCVCLMPTAEGRSQRLPRHFSYKGCKPPHEYWELNLGPLQEHPSTLNHGAMPLAQEEFS